MPLTLLAVLVVAGLALAIGAVHFAGLSKPARLSHPAEAVAALLADYPDEKPEEPLVDADGLTAIMPLGEGRVGLVRCMGSRMVTRILTARDVPDAPTHRDGLVELRLRDFTMPRLVSRFDDEGKARRVAEMLQFDDRKELANG